MHLHAPGIVRHRKCNIYIYIYDKYSFCPYVTSSLLGENDTKNNYLSKCIRTTFVKYNEGQYQELYNDDNRRSELV